MTKQKKTTNTKTQKKAMKRVMHEYKHGDLKTSAGKKVKSRKQAVAIGLSESGASKYKTKKQNARALKKMKQKERKKSGR